MTVPLILQNRGSGLLGGVAVCLCGRTDSRITICDGRSGHNNRCIEDNSF